MDAWYEEEEQVLAHPRDPYHRVDTRESSRHVLVELDRETLTETGRPRLVFETGLPTRYYLPREDVRIDLLTPSETRTLCAYKGEAHYWSARVDGEVYEDIGWSYPDPLADNPHYLLPQRAGGHLRRRRAAGASQYAVVGRISLQRAGRRQRHRAGTARPRINAEAWQGSTSRDNSSKATAGEV